MTGKAKRCAGESCQCHRDCDRAMTLVKKREAIDAFLIRYGSGRSAPEAEKLLTRVKEK